MKVNSLATTYKARHLFAPRIPGSSALLCIYRHRNKPAMLALVAQAKQLGMKIALWALDEPITDLASFTVGSGPGLRMDLLNQLWTTLSPHTFHQVVIADDDIVFTHGSLKQLLSAISYCEFGIAQPAHDWNSKCAYAFTRSKYFMLARQTTFIEPGPLFVITQPWIKHVIPFPDDFGMGWGLWLKWHKLQNVGCKLGILDCISVKHFAPKTREYSIRVEKERLQSLLQEQDLQKTEQAQHTLETWKIWEKEPSWKY